MKCYCVNRDDRPERWDDVQQEFKRIGLDGVIRFPAVIDPIGWKGCRDSHLAILELCKYEDGVMILEDDVVFTEGSSWIIKDALSQIPIDGGDCLYLGASPRQPQVRYSKNLFKLNEAYTTHAIIWHNRKGGAVEYILNHKDDISKVDNYFASVIQPKFNCFVTYPMVATQRQYQSDTCKRSDVSTILTNYNRFCI
jgi:GR25 family glycosyltransferase involved in LPS biosynthesis